MSLSIGQRVRYAVPARLAGLTVDDWHAAGVRAPSERADLRGTGRIVARRDDWLTGVTYRVEFPAGPVWGPADELEPV